MGMVRPDDVDELSLVLVLLEQYWNDVYLIASHSSNGTSPSPLTVQQHLADSPVAQMSSEKNSESLLLLA